MVALGDEAELGTIWTIDSDGTALWPLGWPGLQDPEGSPGYGTVEPVGFPSWSPDGRLAFAASTYSPDGSYGPHVYVGDLDGFGLRQLAPGYQPAWSPDGSAIAYTSPAEDSLWVMDADGSDPRQIFGTGGNDGSVSGPAWSPDGRQIVFAYTDQIYTVRAAGDSPAVRLTFHAGFNGQPDWQPLPGAIRLADGTFSVTASSVIAPVRLALGNVTVTPSSACGRRTLHLQARLLDTDGHVVHGTTVTARSVPAGLVRAASGRTGTLGGVLIALRPTAALRSRRLTLILTARGASRRVSIPVRC